RLSEPQADNSKAVEIAADSIRIFISTTAWAPKENRQVTARTEGQAQIEAGSRALVVGMETDFERDLAARVEWLNIR
ncbi:MAG: hypothetical protein V3V82_04280, partial [Acidimicrobiia bacterium]